LLQCPEIRAAIIALLNLHHGATRAEIPAEVARQFGFKSTGATLRSILDYKIKRMIKLGLVEENDGMIRVAAKPE
jgi:hypothetical protein